MSMSITVSIVEGDATARGILIEWINSDDGLKCVGVHPRAEAALEVLPWENPSVVLVGNNLPGMSGVECVRRLKPQMMGAQFIMLMVYEDHDHIFKALSSGASGYLLKRTPRAGLLSVIQNACAGGSPMSSSIARKIIQLFCRRNRVPPSEPEILSIREREVLELLARGYLYKEIGEALHISGPTVNTHIRGIYEKLHFRSGFQAIARSTTIPKNIVPE